MRTAGGYALRFTGTVTALTLTHASRSGSLALLREQIPAGGGCGRFLRSRQAFSEGRAAELTLREKGFEEVDLLEWACGEPSDDHRTA